MEMIKVKITELGSKILKMENDLIINVDNRTFNNLNFKYWKLYNDCTYTFIISKNGEDKKIFTMQMNDKKAFGWLLNNQSNSINHALKYEGWKVEQINEQTKESEFWKPYF